eukprot:g11788.t1 g11788   contig6:592701-593303(+)
MTLTFKCKCGAVEAKIQGAPIGMTNCHCHSCVASAKFVDAKGDGTSQLLEAKEGEDQGAAIALFKGNIVDFVTDLKTDGAKSKIGFCKVGEKAKFARSFCTGCNTMLGSFLPKGCIVNRNLLTNEDGTPFQPENKIVHIMKKYAFEPEKVPEPSSNMVPIGMVFTTFIPLIAWGGKKVLENKALYCEDLATAEVVPITWE